MRISKNKLALAMLHPHHEIISHKLHRPLHFPLGLTSVRPAQNGFESVESREVLKLPVHRGILLLQKPLDDYLLHIVIQNLLRVASEIPKRVLMAPYQRVCAHICDKFDVPHPRISQNHEKTVQFFPLPILVHQVILEESPVHLPLLPRHRLKPHCCFLIQVHLPAAHIAPRVL